MHLQHTGERGLSGCCTDVSKQKTRGGHYGCPALLFVHQRCYVMAKSALLLLLVALAFPLAVVATLASFLLATEERRCGR